MLTSTQIEGEIKMKRSTKFFTLVLLMAFAFTLSACSSKLESISISDQVVAAAVEDGKVEISELKLTLNLKNGTNEQVEVTAEMITSGDITKLTSPGSYDLTFSYEGLEVVVTFVIPNPSVIGIAVDNNSVTEAQKKEIFDLNDIIVKVIYSDGIEELINLTEDMLSEEDLLKLRTTGEQIVGVDYQGAVATFYINVPTSVLVSLQVNEESILSAYSEATFNYKNILIDMIYSTGEIKSTPITLRMMNGSDYISLYLQGEHTITLNYGGISSSFIVNVPNDKFVNLTQLNSIADGEMVVVKAYSTYYLGSTLYIYDANMATTAVSATASIMTTNDAILCEGKEVIISGVKTTIGDRAGIKSISGILSTNQQDQVSNTKMSNLSQSQLDDNIYKYVDFTALKVNSKPTIFDDDKNVIFEVTDGTNVMKILVPKDEEDGFSQKIFITLSELVINHELVLNNILPTNLDGEKVLYITRKSKVDYIPVVHEYQKPTGEVDNLEFSHFLDDMFLYYLGDSPFNVNYLIYDVEAFDIKYGTDLANAPVVPTTAYDMSPEAEIDYYDELIVKKAQLMVFNRDDLSSSQKLAYDVILDYINRNLKYFEFTDQGENIYFYYGTQLGSYLGYQAQLPSIIAEYRFDNKRDIENYFQYLITTQADFEALFMFEMAKITAGKGNPMTDFVIDLVIEQCDAFIEAEGENYLITVFNDRIDSYDFLTTTEVEEYKARNAQYVNENFVAAYVWLKNNLLQLKAANNDELKGSLSDTEIGKKYYEIMFQRKCGSDMTIPELITYIEAKIAEAENYATYYTEYSGNLMGDANLIIYDDKEKNEYYPSLNGVIPFLQEAVKADFPELPVELIFGKDIIVKEVAPALQENSSPAFYLTSPIDANTSEVFYINPPDFSEVDDYMFTTITHEAWPGHMYQNIYFKNTDAHNVRKVISYTGYSEAWAVYVENYCPKYVIDNYSMQQMFLLDPISSLSACRIDIGVNYEGWGIEEIIDGYGLTMDDVTSGRYTWSSGDTVSLDDFEEIYYFYVEVPTNYLMYYFSFSQMMDIKAEFKDAMGVYYSDELFHTIYLETGDASWPIIKQVYQDYAAVWGIEGTARK
jgi:uncharacterized protein (DUF885 family)